MTYMNIYYTYNTIRQNLSNLKRGSSLGQTLRKIEHNKMEQLLKLP